MNSLIKYKNWIKINESKEDEYIEYSEYIISKIKEQNNIVGIIEDRMLSVQDLYSHVPPIYGIRTKEAYNQMVKKQLNHQKYLSQILSWYDKKWGFHPLITKEERDFYTKVDGYEYDANENYKKDTAKVLAENENFILTLNYVFATGNNWASVKITDEFKEEIQLLSEISTDISFNYEIEHQRMWNLQIHIPIKLKLGKVHKVELPLNIISDFESFVRDYNIDDKGKNRLGAILRKASTE
jgi:hypothetical protein